MTYNDKVIKRKQQIEKLLISMHSDKGFFTVKHYENECKKCTFIRNIKVIRTPEKETIKEINFCKDFQDFKLYLNARVQCKNNGINLLISNIILEKFKPE